MSFKRKFKKAMKHIIGDFSNIKWRDLDHKKVYLAIAGLVAIIALIIVLIVVLISGGKKQQLQNPENSDIAVEEVVDEAEEIVEENPLEVDAYEEVNAVVLQYFNGLSSGDLALVESSVDVLTDEEKMTIEKKKDYIEAYNNVVCYTKKGLEENSYVVFASYDMKIYNIETAAPGIMALYVCMGEDGNYCIFNGEASEELTNYVLELAAEEEVAAVIADVDARYQQLVAENEDLGKFAQTMLESQEEATEAAEEPEAPAAGDGKELEEPVKTTVNDGIRIREARSTESRMLGSIVSGTEVNVYASYEDGWSKIDYSGLKGYCKTEFLTSTEGVPMLSTEEASETTDAETENTASENADVTAVNKTMKFKDTVRIRKERSTESDRIANGYVNDDVKVIENYSDGWSKVEYNGVTGYCKTEFLKEAN